MNWRLYIVIGLLLLAFGCKKERHIVISGTITDYYAESPLEGVEVEIAFNEITYGSVSSGFEIASQTLSGQDGRYTLVFEEPRTSQYRIRAFRDGLILEEELVEATEFTTEEENVVDIAMFFDAGLEISFRQGLNPNSTALFQLGPHSFGCMSCCNEEQSYFISGGDTTITCSLYGNQTVNYELTRLSGGASEVSSGSFVVEQEKVMLELTY